MGPKRIQVGGEQMTATNIYINVGTRPRIPSITGIEEVPWMDSAKLLDKVDLPKKLIIIGGGYIGAEYAQVYRRFGSEVTLIQGADQLMPREDKDVADAIQEFLEEEGIKVICGAKAQSVSHTDEDIELVIAKDRQESSIRGTDLLIATGRIPNSDSLNLEATEIVTNKRGY